MTAVLFLTLVWQVVDFLRELVDFKSNKSAIVTQGTAWAGGILIVLIAAHATVTQAVVIPGLDLPLGQLDAGSIILAGLLISSAASSAVDIKQAIDGSDSATKPPLMKPPAGV